MENLVPLAVVLFAAVVFGVKGVGPMRKRALLVRTPQLPIAELRSGFFIVHGRVRSGPQELRAPMSEKTCIYYKFTVEERRRRSKRSYWHPVVQQVRASLIELEDDTGHATINLPMAEVHFKLDRHLSAGILASMPEPLAQKLEDEFGTRTKGLVFNKRMRVRETMLEVGDALHVIGQVSWGQDGWRIDGGGPLFIVCDQGLARLIWRESLAALAWFGGGLVAVGLGVLILVSQ